MFKTKNLVHQYKDVPVTWIFEHFCELHEKLSGQDVKIKSLFNPKERTPSMCFYLDAKTKVYRYKDFSTGKGGSAIDLVKDIHGLPFNKACNLVIEQYNDYVLHNNGGYDVQEFKHASRYKVASYVFRSWTQHDSKFWTKFNIGSSLLEKYNVRPLSSYTMIKDDKELCIMGNNLYGYFKADGTLYKIYQPMVQDKKFLKVADFVQGSEQLSGHKSLIITSSLKDLMALKSLKLQIDIIAPDSENCFINKAIMEEYIKIYNTIILLFDNDDPGIKAMKKYQERHPTLEAIVLPMSKDPSDSIRDFGAKEVLARLVPLLNKKLSAQFVE